MKYIFCFFMFLPIAIYAQQAAGNVIYAKAFEIKDSSVCIAGTFDFVKSNKAVFFHLRSYTKEKLSQAIDTGGYGVPAMSANTVVATCKWVYQGNKKNGTVLLKGEIIFSCDGRTVKMELQHLHYYKYFDENGKMTLKNEGGYEELDMCKYCNASGMRIGEFVHDNFLHIAAAYGRFIK
ncbi:MAG: hypothetical protein ACTHJ0_12485 [Flavipsychrobacter sp.]